MGSQETTPSLRRRWRRSWDSDTLTGVALYVVAVSTRFQLLTRRRHGHLGDPASLKDVHHHPERHHPRDQHKPPRQRQHHREKHDTLGSLDQRGCHDERRELGGVGRREGGGEVEEDDVVDVERREEDRESKMVEQGGGDWAGEVDANGEQAVDLGR